MQTKVLFKISKCKSGQDAVAVSTQPKFQQIYLLSHLKWKSRKRVCGSSPGKHFHFVKKKISLFSKPKFYKHALKSHRFSSKLLFYPPFPLGSTKITYFFFLQHGIS